jgi:NADP-dependent 3-hydroxy acid dehydrogenase YdfG
MKGYAFITGASAGFGEAIAETLAKEGYKLIIAARRTERLEELKTRLSELHIYSKLFLPCLKTFRITLKY